MKGNKLKILAVSTVVVLALAMVAVNNESSKLSDSQKNVKMFPDLADKINSVTTLVVSQGPKKVTVKLSNGEWKVLESDNYPADVSKVKQVIIKMADFEVIEAKTTKQENYSKLGVEDPDGKDAKSKLVTLNDENSTELAALIVGKQRSSNIANSTTDSLYARKTHDKQSWLIKGELYADLKPRDWIQSDLFSIPMNRVAKVVIRHDEKNVVTIHREKPGDSDFTLSNIPKKKVIKSVSDFRAMAEAVQDIIIKEAKSVNNDKAPKFEDDVIHTELTTFDGLVISVDSVKKGGKHFAKFSVKFDPSLRLQLPEGAAVVVNKEKGTDTAAAAPTPLPNLVKDAQATAGEAAELTLKFKDWVFVISDTKADNLRKTMDDLVKDA